MHGKFHFKFGPIINKKTPRLIRRFNYLSSYLKEIYLANVSAAFSAKRLPSFI